MDNGKIEILVDKPLLIHRFLNRLNMCSTAIKSGYEHSSQALLLLRV